MPKTEIFHNPQNHHRRKSIQYHGHILKLLQLLHYLITINKQKKHNSLGENTCIYIKA